MELRRRQRIPGREGKEDFLFCQTGQNTICVCSCAILIFTFCSSAVVQS